MLPPTLRTHAALLLAECPADLAGWSATVAALCRFGMPPFVVVLTDDAHPDDAAVRAAVVAAGLDTDRLLMFGIGGAMPGAGPVFDAAREALCFVSWRHDCNLLAVHAGAGRATRSLADSAVAQTGLGLVAGDTLVKAPLRSAREPRPSQSHPASGEPWL